MYIFFPIGWMYYFGTNLDQRFSVPDFWPKKDETNSIPFERDEITEELQRLRARRLEARARRMAVEGGSAEEAGDEEVQVRRPSRYLKTLEHGAQRQTVQAPTPMMDQEEGQARQGQEGQQGGKSWYKFW